MGNEPAPDAERGVQSRFDVRNESGLVISSILSLWTVKRAEGRAPSLVLRVSIAGWPARLKCALPFGFGQQKTQCRRQEQRHTQNPEWNGDAVRSEF